MESSENGKKQISAVDFPFICRICFMRSELRLFGKEKSLWNLFQSLMKIKVHPSVDFPKNVCSDCINKLKDISLFIEISRYTDLYFVNEVFSMGVEGGSFPKPKPVSDDYDSEMPRYCRSCLSATHLSPFEDRTSLLQLFQEITGIDVTTSTDTNSICYTCIKELEKASSFLNLSKRNNALLATLACVDIKKEDLNTDDDGRIVGRSELKVVIINFTKTDEFQQLLSAADVKKEVLNTDDDEGIAGRSALKVGNNDEHAIAGNEIKVLDDCIFRSYENIMVKNEFQHLHTTFNIKEELLDNDNLIFSGSSDTNKPFGCSNCDKRFAHKRSLRSHFLIHTGEKPFKCENCDKRFNQKGTLRSHLLTHTGEKPFGCDHCDKRFAHRISLQRHLLTHTGEKPFKCGYCNKRFIQKSNLRNHLLTHTGEQLCRCDYCDKKFAHKKSLQSHLLTHTGEKPFKCENCDKRFIQKGTLRKHLLTHTGEKPFGCDHCDKRFVHKKNLQSHLLTHTGVKPFKCVKRFFSF